MKTFLFSNKILNQLPTESKKKLRFMTILVIIMALLSGCLGGMVATQLLDKPFILGFIVMFIVALLLESFMAMYAKKSFLWLRIMLALLLAVVYALALDTVFFEKDINHYYTEQNQQKTLKLDSLYEMKANVVYATIAEVEARSDSLHKKMNMWSHRIFTEINSGIGNRSSGEGKFAKKWATLSQKDSTRFAPQLQANAEKITALQEGLTALETEKQTKIDALIDPKERGFSERLGALGHLIFKGGNTNMLIWYIGFFLLCLALECLVIIMKRKFAFAYADYGYVVEQQKTHEQAIYNYNRLKTLETHKAMMDEQYRLDLETSKEQMRLQHQDKIEQLSSDHQHKKQVRDLSDYEQQKISQLRASFSGDDNDFSTFQKRDNTSSLNGQSDQ